jgi:arylsulfatase A-like enzyme
MNAVCLVIDRLHAGYVGAYGNSWIETPALDRLASQAFTFDHAWIDSPHLDRLYRSYWQGRHALCPTPMPTDRAALAVLLREAGVNTALLTDEPAVAEHPLAVGFDELIQIDPPLAPQSAHTIDETQLAQCFVRMVDWLQSAPEPFLLWCHLGGLGRTWDAPLDFRRAYWEPGDPEPDAWADVPEERMAEDHDPDHVLSISQAYAGQVSLLDECMGALLEYLPECPAAAETLLMLTSARGFPLGEHRRIGPCDEALYGELAHVPLMLRFGDLANAAGRSQALVEPADLWATLLDYWQIAERPQSPSAASLLPTIRQETEELRDRLCIAGINTERAIRTPAWYLRMAAEPELFAKPDDRWEVNNVADRCHSVVECLEDALFQYEQALGSGSTADLSPLSDVLRNGLD